MAQILASFPAPQHPTYPWEQWTDGRVWVLKQGEDFLADPYSFVQRARKVAARLTKSTDNPHTWTVRTSRSTANGTVTLQFNKETAD